MIFIWRGVGILVPIIFVLSFVVSYWLIDFLGITFPEDFDRKIIPVLVFALTTGVLGYWINYKKRIVEVNHFTGKKDKSPCHSFFFIPVEYWALIVPAMLFALHRLSQMPI